MNLSAAIYEPSSNRNKYYHIKSDKLTKAEKRSFQEVLQEWTETATLNSVLTTWTKRQEKLVEQLEIKKDMAFLLLNVSSLNRYLIDLFSLIENIDPSIIILNGTHHDDKSIKQFEKHCFNFNVFSIRGSNTFGDVLIATHKSINVRRLTKFDKVPNLLVLEIETVPDTVQLVTCYSPPTETIPFELFDCILQNNSNTIFTGDFNAKYKAWSRSVENQKGKELYNWLTSMRIGFTYDVINKFIATSTRSNATTDLIIAPTQIITNSFAVLPSIGNDHNPIVWRPSLKIKCAYQYHPAHRKHWKLFEVFLTFTASYWRSLATAIDHSTGFFSLYERFLSLCLSSFTTITLCETVKPSLPTHIVTMLKHKRFYLTLFRRARHPIFVVLLRHILKDLRKELFMHKRKMWENYCKSFDRCDTKAFWKKAKRNFNSRSPPIEGFLYGNNIVSTPAEMCEVAKSYYEDQF